MDSIQNTKESSELIILMHKAALARDNCALTLETLRGAIIYPKTTVQHKSGRNATHSKTTYLWLHGHMPVGARLNNPASGSTGSESTNWAYGSRALRFS